MTLVLALPRAKLLDDNGSRQRFGVGDAVVEGNAVQVISAEIQPWGFR